MTTPSHNFDLAARAANDGLFEWRARPDRAYFSARWGEMLGLEPAPFEGTLATWIDRIHPEDSDQVREELAAHFDGHRPAFESEHRLRHVSGAYRWFLCRAVLARDTQGMPDCLAGSLTDVHRRHVAEERLRYEAFHDPLTKLPNRNLFHDRLAMAVARSRRSGPRGFAVVYMDLDRFKVINDSLGHAAGDEILVEVGRRLSSALRGEDTAARMGGDEFVVLVDGVQGPADAARVADRLQDAFSVPFHIAGQELRIGASMGIVVGTGKTNARAVLRDADTAMYRAKSANLRYQVFDPTMHEQAMRRIGMEVLIRRSLEERTMELHYQPIVRFPTLELVGFEALARWPHPGGGLLSPSDLIPVAEEINLIASVGAWSIDRACRDIAIWQSCSARPLRMSVNVSATQLSAGGLRDDVGRALRIHGVDPASLTLELTESAVMRNFARAREEIDVLRELGVSVAIDDFGTGYASLAYLQRFPFDVLKVDGTFVRRLEQDKASRQIVRAIIDLAHDLGKDVVAEGIEQASQRDVLLAWGCDFGQGWLFAKAMPAASVTAMFSRRIEGEEAPSRHEREHAAPGGDPAGARRSDPRAASG